jgi:O-antigen ligase
MANKLIYFSICAAICLTTLAYGTVHQPVIALFYLSCGALAVFWAIDGFTSGNFRFSKSLLQIPFILTILYGIIQIVPFGSIAETAGLSGIPNTISLDPFATKNSIIQFAALLIYFSAALAFVDSTHRIRTLVLTITIFGFGFAFFAILQSFLSPTKIYGLYEPNIAAPFGSFVNRHNFAAFMEMAIALPLGLLFVGGIKADKRLIYVTAVVLMGVALILSGSRGGLVSLVATIVFLLILTTKTRSAGSIVLKGVLAIALIGVIIFGASLIGGESSLTRFAETAASNDITSNRGHIWATTLNVIKSNVIFGNGMGAFGVAYTSFDSLSGVERVEQAHNDYLQVAADAGLIGLIIGLIFLGILFRQGWQNTKTENLFRKGVVVGALAGCFSILVHSLFDFVLHTIAISLLFVILAALVIVCGKKQPDDIEVSEKKRRKASVTPISEKRKAIETA